LSQQATGGGNAREGEPDLDLLTYTEAGLRLAEEIAEVRAAVESAVSSPDCDRLRARLADLEAAQQRNARGALDVVRLARFFGHPPESDR